MRDLMGLQMIQIGEAVLGVTCKTARDATFCGCVWHQTLCGISSIFGRAAVVLLCRPIVL